MPRAPAAVRSLVPHRLALIAVVVTAILSATLLAALVSFAATVTGYAVRATLRSSPATGVLVTAPAVSATGAAREFGQQAYTSIFTWDEMSTAAAGLPLRLVADDSVYDYEQEHLPPGAWPPTSWYANWVSGLDVFNIEREKCPIEMRWLVYQKAG